MFLAEGTNLLSQFFDIYKNKQCAKGKQKDYNNTKTTQQIQLNVNKQDRILFITYIDIADITNKIMKKSKNHGDKKAAKLMSKKSKNYGDKEVVEVINEKSSDDDNDCDDDDDELKRKVNGITTDICLNDFCEDWDHIWTCETNEIEIDSLIKKSICEYKQKLSERTGFGKERFKEKEEKSDLEKDHDLEDDGKITENKKTNENVKKQKKIK
ncbi:hypothetical protein RhiirB3_525017 [Rhizophagus irregularis]|nr:hypothetical protein RhiirB3_525017 [Rhizophagus irregularis]